MKLTNWDIGALMRLDSIFIAPNREAGILRYMSEDTYLGGTIIAQLCYGMQNQRRPVCRSKTLYAE